MLLENYLQKVMNLVFVTMSGIILSAPCGAMLKDSDIYKSTKATPKKEQQSSTIGVKSNVNKGWTQTHPSLLAHWALKSPDTEKEEDQKKRISSDEVGEYTWKELNQRINEQSLHTNPDFK